MPVTLQPTSLKYKNQNGTFQSADAIKGDTGPAGPTGATGPQGVPGVGVPTGGTTGQVLIKASGTDYDTEWGNEPTAPVQSVNGQTGAVVLDAQDVGAYEKPAGGIPASDLAAGVVPEVPVQDVQVNGTSILDAQGVANVPVASINNAGVVRTASNSGLFMDGTSIRINKATDALIKSGDSSYYPIVPSNQNKSVFYGLAKAAGDTTQSSSSNAVGNYTENAKSKISEMLTSPVTVTGSTPSITALPGIRYVCGEVATLDITLPLSGIVDVVFESGATATVLTITPPSGVTLKWANGFDPTALEANTTYEINIADGLGVAASWT